MVMMKFTRGAMIEKYMKNFLEPLYRLRTGGGSVFWLSGRGRQSIPSVDKSYTHLGSNLRTIYP